MKVEMQIDLRGLGQSSAGMGRNEWLESSSSQRS
jgi:hypothetical protein